MILLLFKRKRKIRITPDLKIYTITEIEIKSQIENNIMIKKSIKNTEKNFQMKKIMKNITEKWNKKINPKNLLPPFKIHKLLKCNLNNSLNNCNHNNSSNNS